MEGDAHCETLAVTGHRAPSSHHKARVMLPVRLHTWQVRLLAQEVRQWVAQPLVSRLGLAPSISKHLNLDNLRQVIMDNGERLRTLFEMWDEDASGTISAKEFRSALKTLGFRASDDHMNALFDKARQGQIGSTRVQGDAQGHRGLTQERQGEDRARAQAARGEARARGCRSARCGAECAVRGSKEHD